MRYFYQMVRPDLEEIPDFPLPDGMEVRPALPEHYRAIWDAGNEAFRTHRHPGAHMADKTLNILIGDTQPRVRFELHVLLEEQPG